MLDITDNIRIRTLAAITPPIQVMTERPRTEAATATVIAARRAVHDILHGSDDRLIVVVGPCSIHDPAAAMDYAARLQTQRKRFQNELEVIMRVYFEKPRTTIGWKGLINDPMLDGSFQIDQGLRIARTLLLDINTLGVPAGCEFLDVITPQYFADLVAWGAIGARTTESQVHREMASGLSCPVGFKNGTDGGIRIALDAVLAASHPHHFLAVTKDGRSAIAATTGNEDCHVILRGGKAPNYDAASVAAVVAESQQSGLAPRIMIDASHANSSKNPENQPHVLAAVAEQVAAGERAIIGTMAESNLVAGRQNLAPGQPLVYGQSITDGCINWDTTVSALETLAMAVQQRRHRMAA